MSSANSSLEEIREFYQTEAARLGLPSALHNKQKSILLVAIIGNYVFPHNPNKVC